MLSASKTLEGHHSIKSQISQRHTVLVSSPLRGPSSPSLPADGGGFHAVQSDLRGGGGGGRYAAALPPGIRRATVDTARSRSTCGSPRQHEVPPASTDSDHDTASSPTSDFVEGLGVRTAPDDLQDGGQGNVIVGDDAFKRPAFTYTASHTAEARFPAFQ